MLQKSSTKIIISAVLITLGVITRLLPHAFNFTPIAAIALFSGVYLGKRYAITLPLAAMFIGDVFIGFYEWPLMLAVYISFASIGMLGVLIKKYKSLETVIGATLGGSILFFVATNWAVWQFSPWYPHSWSGLLQCLTLAVPFFRNTLIGDLFYTSALFGTYELIKFRRFKSLRTGDGLSRNYAKQYAKPR